MLKILTHGSSPTPSYIYTINQLRIVRKREKDGIGLVWYPPRCNMSDSSSRSRWHSTKLKNIIFTCTCVL